jgi:hypothetical protein
MLILFTLLASASASDLVWGWGHTEPVRYHMETVVETPRSHVWLAEENEQARATRNIMVLDVSCTGAADGKRWDVHCHLDDVSMRGTPVPGEEARLDRVFEVYVGLLKGKDVRLSIGLDGRIRKLDILGVQADDSRMGAIIEGLRQMIRRVFAPVDLQLPKNGDARGKPWSQKGSPLALELLTAQGTSGGVAMKHRIIEERDGAVLYRTEGRGSMAEGSNMEAGTTSFMKVTTGGRGQFNTKLGVLDWAEVSTSAAYSASALNALSGVGAYSYTGWMVRVDETGARLEIPAFTAP